MPRPVLNPGAVLWSGENSYIRLRDQANENDLTRLALYRIIYSPVGEGHVALCVSDLAGDGLSGDDPCATYTDNPELVRWLRSEVVQNPYWNQWEMPTVAATFSYHGDTRTCRTERIEADGHVIEVNWAKLDRPYMYEGLRGDVSDKFDMFCLLISAWQIEMTVNGQKAVGKTYPMEFKGDTISDSCLSLSETWVVPDA